jgi:hypothetical protein
MYCSADHPLCFQHACVFETVPYAFLLAGFPVFPSSPKSPRSAPSKQQTDHAIEVDDDEEPVPASQSSRRRRVSNAYGLALTKGGRVSMSANEVNANLPSMTQATAIQKTAQNCLV